MPKALPEVALATIQVCNQWKTLRKRNKKDLARTFGGSETSWKHRMYPLITLNFGLNMRNAIKMFHESRDSEVSEELIDGMQRETLMKIFFQKSFLTGMLIPVTRKTLSLSMIVTWRHQK